MPTPCPHCHQHVTPNELGVCPLCGGDVVLPADPANLVTDKDAVLFERDVLVEADVVEADVVEADVVEREVTAQSPTASPAPTDAADPNPYAASRAEPQSEPTTELGDPALLGRPGPGLLGAIGIMVAVWAIQFVAAILAVFVAVAIGLLDLQTLRSGSEEQRREHFRQFLEQDGMNFLLPFGSASVLLVALIAVAFLRRDLKAKLCLRPFSSFQFLLVAMAAAPASLLAAQVARFLPSWAVPQMPGPAAGWPIPDWALMDIHVMAISWPVLLVSISILPGISEEILFRGVIGRGLLARYGIGWGIVLTSFLFGVAHLPSGGLPQAVFAFFLGLLLHFIYVNTRSLLAPIVFHMFVNGVFLLAMAFADQFPIAGYNQQPPNQMTPWPLLALCAALLGTILWAMRLTRTRFVLGDGTAPAPRYDTPEPPPREWGPRAFSKDAHGALVLLLLVLFCAFVIALSQVGRMAG